MSIHELLKAAERLPVVEKWQLVTYVLRSLKQEQTVPRLSDWHEALRATYVILAADPIERPPAASA